MTKERFRQLVKRLHPDMGGDSSVSHMLRAVLNCWKFQQGRHSRRYKKCWCGVTINAKADHCRLHMRQQPIASLQ